MTTEQSLAKWIPIMAVALGAVGWGFKIKFDVEENKTAFEQYKKDMKLTIKDLDNRGDDLNNRLIHLEDWRDLSDVRKRP